MHADKDYGPNSQQPDMPCEQFKLKCDEYVKSPELTDVQRHELKQ